MSYYSLFWECSLLIHVQSPVRMPHYCLHHQYKHQQGTIHYLSPGKTPYFVPKSKMISLSWDHERQDLYILQATAPQQHSHFLLCFLFPIFHPCPKNTLGCRFLQRLHVNTKALGLQIEIDIVISNIALCSIAFNFSMWSHWIRACDIFGETNKMVFFSVDLPLR